MGSVGCEVETLGWGKVDLDMGGGENTEFKWHACLSLGVSEVLFPLLGQEATIYIYMFSFLLSLSLSLFTAQVRKGYTRVPWPVYKRSSQGEPGDQGYSDKWPSNLGSSGPMQTWYDKRNQVTKVIRISDPLTAGAQALWKHGTTRVYVCMCCFLFVVLVWEAGDASIVLPC